MVKKDIKKFSIRLNRVYQTATRLNNELLKTYFDDYNSIIDSEKEEMDKTYDLTNLFNQSI